MVVQFGIYVNSCNFSFVHIVVILVHSFQGENKCSFQGRNPLGLFGPHVLADATHPLA